MEVFKENVNPILFHRLRWLGLARNQENNRPALQHVCVRKDDAVCTDGSRLHIVKDTFGLAPGLYTFMHTKDNGKVVEKFGKTEMWLTEDTSNLQFPDVDLVLSNAVEDKLTSKKGYVSGDTDVAYAVLIRAMVKKNTMNFYYFENLMFAEVEFDVWVGAEGKAIYFENEIYRALIMPKLIKNEGSKFDGKSRGQGSSKEGSTGNGAGSGKGKPTGNKD